MLPALQQAREPAGAVAPHRVDQDLETGVLDRLDVDQAGNLLQVSRGGVETLHLPGGLGLGEWDALRSGRVVGDQGFDLFQPAGGDRPAELVAHLEAVIGGRVVRSGDIDGSRRLPGDDRVGDDRRGRGSGGQMHLEVVGCQDFCHRGGEVLGVEAHIIPDHDALPLAALLLHVTGKALGAAAHVVEGIVFGDQPAPAVGSKYDFSRHRAS